MNSKLIILLCISQIAGSAYAGDFTAEQCGNAVAAVDGESSQPNRHNIKIFLESLTAKRCQINAEYAEWSNEASYNLMRRVPALYFSTIRDSSTETQKKIVAILENPIHDLINYPEIDKSIRGIKDAKLRDYAIKLFSPYYKRHLDEVESWEKKNNRKWQYGN